LVDAPESSQSYLTISDVGRKFLTDLKPTKEEYCVYGSSGGYEYSLDVDSREKYSYNTITTVSSFSNYLSFVHILGTISCVGSFSRSG
jgi:hypothetical protein